MSGDRLSSLQWRILGILSGLEPPWTLTGGAALELRDLEDVRALLESGGDLERALADAPLKDGGFSPLTLAWVLKGFQPRALAPAIGMDEETTDRLEHFKENLIQHLLGFSSPAKS
jgi:hypothetical protein